MFRVTSQEIEEILSPKDTLTSKLNIENYVGKLITIKGEITKTKIPQIIGIDVSCKEYSYLGKIGIATGILEKRVVVINDSLPINQNRGNGTFYRLKAIDSTYEAEIKIIED